MCGSGALDLDTANWRSYVKCLLVITLTFIQWSGWNVHIVRLSAPAYPWESLRTPSIVWIWSSGPSRNKSEVLREMSTCDHLTFIQLSGWNVHIVRLSVPAYPWESLRTPTIVWIWSSGSSRNKSEALREMSTSTSHCPATQDSISTGVCAPVCLGCKYS